MAPPSRRAAPARGETGSTRGWPRSLSAAGSGAVRRRPRKKFPGGRPALSTFGAVEAPPARETAPGRLRPERKPALNEPAGACRVDVWLWRARFFKTRSLAARIVEEGGVRLARADARISIDKPSRSVRCGDVLTFAQGSRFLAVRVEALGERRGPAPEARGLYTVLDGQS